jgi:orotidine-5'-phosphate decarboxylase
VSLTPKDRLIVALDVAGLAEAKMLIQELAADIGMFKVGLELFTACGNEILDIIEAAGGRVFFDGKFHDIPNTVAGASRAVVKKGPVVSLFNLHAMGGRKMMEAAKVARDEAFAEANTPGARKPDLIAVTILTSIRADELASDLKVEMPLGQMVPYLAQITKECGLDGVVASAQEATAIRELCGPDFLIVTPGIRPSWAGADDQARIVTPVDAITHGADMIVVGRPITRAADKKGAARRIVEELSGR